MSHQGTLSFLLFVLNVGTTNALLGAGGVLGWTLNPAETGWPGIFPDVEGFVLKLLPLPVGSLFKKKPHAGLDHRTGSVAMAPL